MAEGDKWQVALRDTTTLAQSCASHDDGHCGDSLWGMFTVLLLSLCLGQAL